MPLPLVLTPLLGRSHELDETQRLLERTRLLTLTGAGGSGKTRLAAELALRARNRFDEVVWVDLAPISEPDLLAQQILTSLGSHEAPSQEEMDLVLESIADRPVLLVLDNCEHVIDASARAAETILRGAPQATILATTREALGIAGEQVWLVPPLCTMDAAQLFLERARAVEPSFTIDASNEAFIEQICTRLDGIPLAIELAAARVKVLPPEQIAERLSDAFRLLSSGSRTVPRHRTIRETIDWSFRLLSDDEQVLFRRLAVFAGSFTLTAVEQICGENALECLSALVDKSLLLRERTADARYRLLETVRQFAAEKLSQAGEIDSMRERHARFYLTAIEKAEPRLFAGAVDRPTLDWLDQEIGNIRVVFDWAEERPERADVELRLVYSIHWYWFARGHFHEARRRIDQALTRVELVDAAVRARAFVAAGDTCVWQGAWSAIRPSIDEAVRTLRAMSEPRALASALVLLGIAHAFADKDDYNAARVFEEATAIARAEGRNVGLALTLYWGGIAGQLRGDFAMARAAFEETRDIGESLGNKPAIGHANTVLGYVALHERNYAEAIRCFRRALEVHTEIDDRWGLTQVVEGIGLALLDSGEPENGIRLLAAASAAWLHLGARPGRDEDFEREKDARIRRALADDRLRVVLASGAAIPYDAMVELAREEAEKLSASSPARSPLRVRALGPLEIERDGTLVESASSSARARELLLYLLLQPRGATKEQIGAALWPDADGARLRNNFHVTMHRLRKLLGGADWISADGETYSLNRRHIEFDVDLFEQEARAAIRGGEVDRLARAAELYRGDFLQHATAGEWSDAVRKRLRDLAAGVLTALGRARTAAGDLRGATDAYERLVAIDVLDEDATRNLMTILAKLGDTSGAARAYRRLSDALRRELGASPDSATERLHAQLRNG